jgi:hypothetical protein
MTTTELIRPPRPPAEPTFDEELDETLTLIGVVPVYGPPVVVLAGPWLFLVLMLAGPFACLFALVVAMLVAATILAALTTAIVAILAAPCLLVGHLRRHRHRERPASIAAPAAPAVAIESRRVAA